MMVYRISRAMWRTATFFALVAIIVRYDTLPPGWLVANVVIVGVGAIVGWDQDEAEAGNTR